MSEAEATEEYHGPDRRQGSRADRRNEGSDRRQNEGDTGDEKRSGWDRRRGPGRRRTEDRRSAEEGEMNDEQFAFLQAVAEYKKVNKRPFPSFTELLEILKALGYRKVAEPTPLNKE